GDGLERLRADLAGVVDQDVYRPERALGPLDESRDIGRDRHVGLHGESAPAEVLDRLRRGLRLVAPRPVAEGHVHPRARKRQADGAADTAIPTRDERNPAGDVVHSTPSVEDYNCRSPPAPRED